MYFPYKNFSRNFFSLLCGLHLIFSCVLTGSSFCFSLVTVILHHYPTCTWKSSFKLSQLSPSDLLNSRDKFRQAPPPELPQLKYGEVERFFGALITLYHIRKLLSSHGIRPAYEMLEEKLHQGYGKVHVCYIFIRCVKDEILCSWRHAA